MVMISVKGGYVSSNAVYEVRRARPKAGDKYSCESELIGKNADSLGTTSLSPEQVEESVEPVVAAFPGFFVILPPHEDETAEQVTARGDAVVAWRVGGPHSPWPEPVSASGLHLVSDWRGLLHPNGRVSDPNGWYEGVAEWIKSRKKAAE